MSYWGNGIRVPHLRSFSSFQHLPVQVSWPTVSYLCYDLHLSHSPIHAYWDLAPTYPYKCLNDGAIVFSASVINIFTDFLVTVLPMPLIWNLKLPTRQRIAVISIFGLGIVVNVAGSVRTVYVWKSMIASYDTTWVGWPVLLAASVEINMGLVCPLDEMGTIVRGSQVTRFVPLLRHCDRLLVSFYLVFCRLPATTPLVQVARVTSCFRQPVHRKVRGLSHVSMALRGLALWNHLR